MVEPRKEIELRSEEVQDILTRPPHALVRWGISVFFAVLALLFVGGCFLKYPDVISAPVTVTTEHPPVWLVARSSGKVKAVYRSDYDSVRAGDLIAVLENPAETDDVLHLAALLEVFVPTDSAFLQQHFPERPILGEVQGHYATFLRNLTDYRNFCSLNLYEQKIEATRRELQEYRNYIAHLKRQELLDKEQLEIATVVRNREKLLYDKGLIAKASYEEAQMTFLNKQQNSESLQSSLSSARIQEAQLRQNMIETEMERNREANSLMTQLKTSYDALLVGIEEWKLSYLFVAPSDGVLSYNNIWQRNQNVSAGDKVFSIVTQAPGSIIGKIKLSATGTGKVRPGQRVNISVDSYPYLEFGFLTGEILSVSLLPDDESVYTATVSLPQDLCTSYGKPMEFKGELTGTAEILTDERSVTLRLLSPLRYLSEKHF